jgi:TonB family protein
MQTYFLQVALCWFVAYLIYQAFLRKHTFFALNRWYLVGSVLLGMVLPMMDWAALLPAPQQELAAVVFQPIQAVTLQLIEVTPGGAVREEASGGVDWLTWLYGAGVVLSAGYMLLGFARIGRLFFQAERTVKGGYILVESDRPHLPFSFLHCFFLSKAISYDAEERAAIEQHELAHIRGVHSFDILLLTFVQIFFWFNPLVYLFQVAIRDTHEYIADRAVLQTAKRKEYGHMLIRQSISGPQIALVNAFISSQLKKRIVMMTQPTSPIKTVWRYLLVLPVVAFMMMAFSSHSDAIYPTIEKVLVGEADEMPRFPGCEDLHAQKDKAACANQKMMTFIIDNLKYPKAAKENGIEGKVIVSFTVETDGSLSDIQAVKGIGSGCDEAAIAVVEAMPNWVPGTKDGKKVAVSMKLPFVFKLPAEEPYAKGEEIFKVVEDMPRFPGCEDQGLAKDELTRCSQKELLEFIYQNLSYPAAAREAGKEGTVVVSFVVGKEGRLRAPKIVRDPHEALSREVLRVISLMNQMDEAWTPGYQGGKVVNVQFMLPVRFRLDNANDEPKTGALEVDNYQVFPNPSNGAFTVNFEATAGPLTMQVTDFSGKPVWNRAYEAFDGQMQETIDLNDVPAGVYVLKITQKDKARTEILMVQ